jgi:hypothetical protein
LENILTHCQRGIEQYGAKVEEGSTLTYKQVLNPLEKPKWEEAIVKEVNNMMDYEVWDVIDRTPEEKPSSCKWVFKIKPEESNQAKEFKARLCVQGWNKVFGQDYNFTYAPTGKLTSLCLLINFALQHD